MGMQQTRGLRGFTDAAKNLGPTRDRGTVSSSGQISGLEIQPLIFDIAACLPDIDEQNRTHPNTSPPSGITKPFQAASSLSLRRALIQVGYSPSRNTFTPSTIERGALLAVCDRADDMTPILNDRWKMLLKALSNGQTAHTEGQKTYPERLSEFNQFCDRMGVFTAAIGEIRAIIDLQEFRPSRPRHPRRKPIVTPKVTSPIGDNYMCAME